MSDNEFNNNNVYKVPFTEPDNAPQPNPTQNNASGNDNGAYHYDFRYQQPQSQYHYQYQPQYSSYQHPTEKQPKVKKEKKHHRGFGFAAAMVALVLVTNLATGGILYGLLSDKISDRSSTVSGGYTQSVVDYSGNTASVNVAASDATKYDVIKQIAANVGPAVVGIKLSAYSQSFMGEQSFSEICEGSGVIISGDGYIVTNNHVVEYAKSSSQYNLSGVVIEVVLQDDRSFEAELIGCDEMTDLAVIKIDADDLTVAKLGSSASLAVGDMAVVIGNPLGMEFYGSVTDGIISGLDRSVTIDDTTMNLIQTNAAVNSGNSGGALLNASGEVVGIVNSKVSVSGVEGLGFAIPIDDAKPIIDDLIRYGYVKNRPYIGLSGGDVSSVMSTYYGWPEGVYVGSVTAGSAAEKAGIRMGDVIVELDGEKITSMVDIDSVKSNHSAGDTVSIVVYRNGENITLSLTFDEYQNN